MSDAPQSIPSLLDDDTLNEHERAFIQMFENARPSPSQDDGSLVSAETEPESGTPESTPASAAPDAPTSVEGPTGASETEPSTPSDTQPPTNEQSTPAEGEPTGDEHAQSTPAFTFAGVEYSPEQLTNAVRVHEWFNKLPDEAVRAIDGLLSGQYTLQPAHPATPTPPAPAAPAAPTSQPPASETQPTPRPEDAGDWLDPRAQAEINRLRAEQQQLVNSINQLQQTVQSSVPPLVQSQQELERQRTLQAIDNGTATFREQYHLDDSAIEQIQKAVVDAGVLPSLVTRHNGNLETATRAALDMMFWTTPQFRDSYLSQKTAAEQAAILQDQASNTRKQQALTALSASGGSVPRRDPVPSDRESRFQAMVNSIAADQNGS